MTDPDREQTTDDLDAVLATVRERTTPTREERDRLQRVAAELTERTERAVATLPSPADEADVIQVGSTARGTWLPGDRDVDLFVRFPTDLDREQLESFGLRVGHETLPDGREEYAEHPYVVGTYEGFDVDLVPCFDVSTASDIRSAVDRTPFHTDYLRERLDDDLAADVRVFKQLLTAIGAYGSDLRTEGFSGYLAELLVVEYDGLRPLLTAATEEWHPQIHLDPEEHGTATFDDPLVVIDPTDPERNVAAVCSAENVARLQHYARAVLDDPDADQFVADECEPLTPEVVRTHIERRGTDPVAVAVDVPDLVDDQLYPQLRRSLAGIERELHERGFDVFRSTTFASETGSDGGAGDEETDGSNGGAGDEETDTSDGGAGDEETDGSNGGTRRAVFFIELAHATLPRVERHEGPPVHVRDHAHGFYEKYADDSAGAASDADDTYGPFLTEGRYVVERERDAFDAVAFLDSDRLLSVALGARIEDALESGYEVYAGDDVAELADDFGAELRAYFDPRV
jgi:tRNA nucleotidyltransferase (CCA-adding enzyme)